MENILENSYYAGPRFTLIILGTFGVTGLLPVLIGIFSVMAYTVSLQTHEIGIRMAIGAQQKDVLPMVLKQGLTLIFMGTRFMASEIWNVSTTDPWTFSVVAAIVIVVGLTASVFPARRAARVDPIAALRYD